MQGNAWTIFASSTWNAKVNSNLEFAIVNDVSLSMMFHNTRWREAQKNKNNA